MNYKITHTTTYTYADTVPVCHNEIFLTPREDRHQACRFHRLSVKPQPAVMMRRQDFFGNLAHHFTIQDGHRRLSVTATSRVEIRPRRPPDVAASPPWESLCARLESDRSPRGIEACQFVFDSPCIERSAELADFARPSFPPGRPLLDAVRDLTRRIHAEFHYDADATAVHTRPDEVLRLRRGVCQDFAHVQIGCLRSLGLAARYVSGYLRTIPPPGQPRLIGVDTSHAWLSVYAGDAGWIDVDPTNNLWPTDDHITLAWGRDYSDVCPIKGVFIGGGPHTMSVAVDVEPLDAAP